MVRLINSCFAAALFALLSACSGTPISPTASNTEIAQKAVALISVSHDAAGGNGANAIFYLDEARMPGRVVMMSTQSGLTGPVKSEFTKRRGHLYVLELEPGSHSIDGWQVANAGARLSAPIAPLRFEIKQGEVLYLGNLHAKLAFGRGLFGISVVADATPMVVDQQGEDIALAEARVPALKGKVRVALLNTGPLTLNRDASKKFDPLLVPKVPAK